MQYRNIATKELIFLKRARLKIFMEGIALLYLEERYFYLIWCPIDPNRRESGNLAGK
jgi:hypothetical protein